MRYYRKYLNTKKLRERISHTSDFDREIFNLKGFTERLWKRKMMQQWSAKNKIFNPLKPEFKVTAKNNQVLS